MDRSYNILYLGYWGINDVLTVSSVFPTLRCLSAMENVSEVIFCSIERNKDEGPTPVLPSKVRHIALRSRQTGNVFVTKFFDFVRFPTMIKKALASHNINLIICRSALAGGMMLSIARRKKIPIIIESFEPHSDYMIESGVWSRGDLRAAASSRMESQLKREAAWLLPVSENYRSELIREGIDADRVIVVPCTVDADAFSLNLKTREVIRAKLEWTDRIVGIYIGKFGGIYYSAEAFEQFKAAFRHFGRSFSLIILTAQEEVQNMAKQYLYDEMTEGRVIIRSVAHHEVVDYLNAADFAFSTIKPAPSRRFCSPIKHGEYWANGLPIITEAGIGDDSDIIKDEGGGVILERPMYDIAFRQIGEYITKGRAEIYPDIRGLALKYRSENRITEAYKRILG